MGTGIAQDAAIQIKSTTWAADATAWTYGIDMNQDATFGTADIRLSDGALIANSDADTLTITEATINLTGNVVAAGTYQQTSTGASSAWSHNLVSVTATAGVGEGTRGWRVNMTTGDSATIGDMQSLHGYLTMGATPTLAAGAAIGPLSAWLEMPNTTTTSTGNVIAGVRAIFQANNNDLSTMAGGGESALFYGQTWGAGSGAIDHGIRVIAGATTTISNAISIAGDGSSLGTITRMIDWTEGPAGFVTLFTAPTADAQTRHLQWYMGDSATRADVWAEVSVVDGLGSLYFSSAGKIYMRVDNAGAATDWQKVTTSAAD
ncbi:hypothetical protein ACFL0A_00920 [Patescibacteria group bacterium]